MYVCVCGGRGGGGKLCQKLDDDNRQYACERQLFQIPGDRYRQ